MFGRVKARLTGKHGIAKRKVELVSSLVELASPHLPGEVSAANTEREMYNDFFRYPDKRVMVTFDAAMTNFLFPGGTKSLSLLALEQKHQIQVVVWKIDERNSVVELVGFEEEVYEEQP